jgi:hypothetical protein
MCMESCSFAWQVEHLQLATLWLFPMRKAKSWVNLHQQQQRQRNPCGRVAQNQSKLLFLLGKSTTLLVFLEQTFNVVQIIWKNFL